MEPKLLALREILRSHSPLLVAYSGGVDSAYLLAEAFDVLGPELVLGVIADSPSLPRKALKDALAVAEQIGVPVEVVRTEEMANPSYAANPMNRCYFCKAELFTQMNRLAGEGDFSALAYGENADDATVLRPGSQAAAEFKVLAPLKEAGLTKSEIRQLSRKRGLPTADAPAQPCLSSRIPHGTPVTASALRMVEPGEEWVRSLGFSVFRVRHIVEPETETCKARVQIAPEEMPQLARVKGSLEQGLVAVGYQTVEIDPEGYRAPSTK